MNRFSQRTRSKHTRPVRESSDKHSGTVSIKGQDQNTQDLSLKGHRQSEQHSVTVSIKGQDQNTQDLSLKKTSSQSDPNSGTVSINGQDQMSLELSQYSKAGSLIFWAQSEPRRVIYIRANCRHRAKTRHCWRNSRSGARESSSASLHVRARHELSSC